MPTNAAGLTKLILLIDGENIAAKYADTIVKKSGELGTLVDIRLYGHFATQMAGWAGAIKKHRMTKVDVSQVGEDSADFKLAIEATDILHHRQLDGFCIASSDVGFSVLVERIRLAGLSIFGFAERDRTTYAYTEAFDQYFELKPKGQKTAAGDSNKSSAAAKRKSPKGTARVSPKTAPNGANPVPAKSADQPMQSDRDKPELPDSIILEVVGAAKSADGLSVSALGNKLRGYTEYKPVRALAKRLKSTPTLEVYPGEGKGLFVRRKPR